MAWSFSCRCGPAPGMHCRSCLPQPPSLRSASSLLVLCAPGAGAKPSYQNCFPLLPSQYASSGRVCELLTDQLAGWLADCMAG
eukprot:365028-Chlamydomonas_euryale.AAC.33